MRVADEDLRDSPSPAGPPDHLIPEGVVIGDLHLLEGRPLATEKGLRAGAVAAPTLGVDDDVLHDLLGSRASGQIAAPSSHDLAGGCECKRDAGCSPVRKKSRFPFAMISAGGSVRRLRRKSGHNRPGGRPARSPPPRAAEDETWRNRCEKRQSRSGWNPPRSSGIDPCRRT